MDLHTASPSDATVAAIAQEMGTPCWIYDTAPIRRRAAQLKDFDVVRYAQKANSNIHILVFLKSLGIHIDSVSLGELERALRAGHSGAGEPSGIVFTSDLMDRATLKRVVELDIPVNAGSPQMLEQLGQAHPGHRVWLRINPGFGHGHSTKTNTGGENSKHGVWHGQLDACYRLIQQHKLELAGLHMHIGSGGDYAPLQQVCDAMAEHAIRCPLDVKAISTGGGLPVAYRAGEPAFDLGNFFALWDGARKRIERHFGHPVLLETEPGRVLVAEAGKLVAEVRAKKDMGGNHFVLVDAGFNDLMRPAMYGAFHRISALRADGTPRVGGERPTVVAGPLCESGDVFTQKDGGEVTTQMLPEVEVGDLLLFHDCGAYGASMSSNYNSRPLAPEVLVEDGKFRQIRRRQTIEELMALELGA